MGKNEALSIHYGNKILQQLSREAELFPLSYLENVELLFQKKIDGESHESILSFSQ